MSIDHAGEHVMEIGVGLDVVKFAGLNQGTENCPSMTSAVAAREEMIFSSENDRSDRTFDRVRVKFYAAIVEESGKRWPAGDGVAYGIRDRGTLRHKRQLPIEP
jgi:hypothetical protein